MQGADEKEAMGSTTDAEIKKLLTDVAQERANAHARAEAEATNWKKERADKLDARLYDVSKKITDPKDLRNLAITGLGIKQHEVNVALSNNSDITEAANHVINNWRKSVEDPEDVYKKLTKALRENGLASVVPILDE